MINYDEFIICCEQFINTSNNLKDGWEVVHKDDKLNYNYYLSKRQHVLTKIDKPISDVEKVPVGNQEEIKTFDISQSIEDIDIPDKACFLDCAENSTWIFEYHIIFSIAYNVPVLYFKVWDNGGNIISLDEIWGYMISCDNSTNDFTDKWKTVTQGHHPIQGAPFYFFHPCHTSDVMKCIKDSLSWEKCYIPSWLGIYGYFIGISIPLKYFETL